MLKGGCFCGAVRYEADGSPSLETNCHCSICRRTSGAPYVTWFTVPAAGFRSVSGGPATFESSGHGTRMFCPHCGTLLAFRSKNYPGEIDVTACSLDDPEAVPPKDHTYVRSMLSWVRPGDGLPRHPGAGP